MLHTGIFYVLTLEMFAVPRGNPHPPPHENLHFKLPIWHLLRSFGLLIGRFLNLMFWLSKWFAFPSGTPHPHKYAFPPPS